MVLPSPLAVPSMIPDEPHKQLGSLAGSWTTKTKEWTEPDKPTVRMVMTPPSLSPRGLALRHCNGTHFNGTTCREGRDAPRD